MRIRNSVLVAVLSLGIPAGLITEPAFGQAAQPTAQELYASGIELYNAGELKQAQQILRKVDPLQLPRDKQPVYYNTLFAIDQKLSAAAEPAKAVEADAAETPAEVEATEAPALPEPEVVVPDNASLLRQADAMAPNNPAEALSVYQQVAASVDASDEQKATAQARIAGIERRLNDDITSARRLITLAEADIVAGNINAAEDKLASVRNSGIELGFFDNESVNKKLGLINEVRVARAAAAAAAAEAQAQADAAAAAQAAADAQAMAEADKAEAAEDNKELSDALARAQEAEAKLAAMQRKLAEEQVTKGAPVSDLMIQARANTAADKVAEGDEALRAGKLNAAVKLYEDATLLAPDNQAYADKLTAARAELNAQVRPAGILPNSVVDFQVDIEKTLTEFQMHIDKAVASLENQDFQASEDSISSARVILDRGRNLLSATQFDELSGRANRLQAEVRGAADRARAAQVIAIEADRKKREDEVTRQNETRKIQEIQSRLIAARNLQMEYKYTEAIAELEAALFLDPANPVITGLLEMIQDSAIARESRRLHRARDLGTAEQRLLNIEASTPFNDILTYPGDWPELSALRLRSLDTGGNESEANRNAQAALRKIVTLNQENLSLSQVIAFIRDTTGANIAVNWPALEIVGVTQESLVTISLSRVPAQQLLQLVLDQVSAEAFDDDKAGFSVSEGIIKISTIRDLKQETETRVYDIRDLLVQVPNFNTAPGFDLDQALSNTSSGGSGGGGGGGGGGEGLFGGDDGGGLEEDLPSRQELVDQIRDLITTTVGNPDEWLDEESTLTELNGNMIIKTTGENHRDILGLLGRLRETRAVQISVEARFLSVQTNFLDEFLVDFDINLPGDEGNFTGGTVGANQSSNTVINRPSTVVGRTPFAGITRSPGVDTIINTEDDIIQTNESVRALSTGFQFLSDIQVDFLLEATQGNRNSIGLTAPRITFFNGQRAYTLVATQTAFVSDLEPIPDSIGFDPTVSVITTGVVLDVEGTISSDRRYVTMTLRPSLANLIALEDFGIGGGGILDPDGIPGSGDEVLGQGGNIQVPEIQITQVRNTVSIPDRGTLLIGGQRLVGEVEMEVGVPVLSKVPVLNRLFTSNTTIQDESTLLILVRPTIIIQSEQEEILFPGMNDNPTDFNIGNFQP